jgi:hypothetical protein
LITGGHALKYLAAAAACWALPLGLRARLRESPKLSKN